jgi:hypothetical protein
MSVLRLSAGDSGAVGRLHLRKTGRVVMDLKGRGALQTR